MPELKLEVADLAQSCYRVWHLARGLNPSEWQGLSYEDQKAWVRVAIKAEQTLERCEGMKYQDAARQLALASVQSDEEKLQEMLSDQRDRIAWEALTRHLMCLYDDADDYNLSMAEETWAQWGAERQPALEEEERLM